MNNDKINKFGSVFRFVTPFLLGISLFILNGIRGDLQAVEKRLDKRICYVEENYVAECEFVEVIKRLDEKMDWLIDKNGGRK